VASRAVASSAFAAQATLMRLPTEPAYFAVTVTEAAGLPAPSL
jgi:hypothetical protein